MNGRRYDANTERVLSSFRSTVGSGTIEALICAQSWMKDAAATDLKAPSNMSSQVDSDDSDLKDDAGTKDPRAITIFEEFCNDPMSFLNELRWNIGEMEGGRTLICILTFVMYS